MGDVSPPPATFAGKCGTWLQRCKGYKKPSSAISTMAHHNISHVHRIIFPAGTLAIAHPCTLDTRTPSPQMESQVLALQTTRMCLQGAITGAHQNEHQMMAAQKNYPHVQKCVLQNRQRATEHDIKERVINETCDTKQEKQ